MTEEQKALVNKAKDSIRAAELLFNDGFYEFAVSRTYYAMFYIAESMLLQLDLSFSKHSAVIANFGKEFVKTGKIPEKFHQYLIEAQNIRNIGDYDVIRRISKEEAEIEIGRAKKFLKLVSKN